MRIAISFTEEEHKKAHVLADLLAVVLDPARIHAPTMKDGKYHLTITSKN